MLQLGEKIVKRNLTFEPRYAVEEATIRERLRTLPVRPVGVMLAENECIEEDEQGAHFIVSHQAIGRIATCFFLSLSGDPNGQNRVLKIFRHIFNGEEDFTDHQGNITYYLWLANRLRG